MSAKTFLFIQRYTKTRPPCDRIFTPLTPLEELPKVAEHINQQYTLTKISDLTPYDKNSRLHDEQQLESIAKSIEQFGFTSPILIDENNNVLAGHGRIQAGELLGLTEVPCVIIKGLTDEQKRAYIIADNQLATTSSWDMDILKSELGDLQGMDFDMGVLGFGDGLDEILKSVEKDALFDVPVADTEVKAPEKKEEVTKTSEGFCEFAIVLTFDEKSELVKKLNMLKQEHNLESQRQALMLMVAKHG